MATAAMRPASGPKVGFTAKKRSSTVSDPAMASGASMLHELRPKMRADSSINQSEAGGLSTVMKLPASRDPKKKAFQLWVPAWTAAA